MTGLACMAAAFSWADVRWWMVGSGAALGLLVSVVLFYVSNFGGGDAKLIIGLGALLGPVALWIVLFWMALAGGVLALIALAARSSRLRLRARHRRRIHRLPS